MSDFEKYRPVPPIKARADDAKRAVCMKIKNDFDRQTISERFRKDRLACRSARKSSKS
jgi:hypothetical protein